MRSLILVTDTNRGGAPVRCASIAVGLREFGWESMIVSVKPAGPVLRRLAGQSVPVGSLDLTHPLALPAAAMRLRRIVRAWQPDVVQSSLWHANLLARVGLRRTVPVVGTSEGVEDGKPAVRVWLDRATNTLSAAEVAVCDAVARVRVERDWVAPERLTTIPTGIDLDYWQPGGRRRDVRSSWDIPDETRIVGWVGRMAVEKNLQVLLEALESLPGWKLALAGDGPTRPALVAEIRRRRLASRVIDMGELSDVRPFLEAIDVFALPSTEEGVPVAVLEAMAMGRPVVAAPVGGLPELITSGENGLLVETDDPKAFALAIDQARSARELGSRGRQTVEARHGAVAMLTAYDHLWRSVA